VNSLHEGLPKYHVVKRNLLEKINEDVLTEDQKIPSERELIEEFGVSRITVRKALDELVNEGHLYRIQGKGTYVKGDKTEQDLFSITSCTKDIINHGMRPRRKLLGLDIEPANDKRSKLLEIDPKDAVLRLDRIYYADEMPVNRTITYLSKKLFPGLEKHDFTAQSLYEVLEREYNVTITRAKRTIEAVLAHGKTAHHLEIEDGFPIILFQAVTHGVVNGREVPFETFKCFYRTDQFKFYIDQVK